MRLTFFAGRALVLVGCHSAPAPKVAAPEWKSQDERLLACLDLQDHVVDLYAMAYMVDNNVPPQEFKAFRDGWARELAHQGTFERFEMSCFPSLTRAEYDCAIDSRSTTQFIACMKLSGNGTPKLGAPESK